MDAELANSFGMAAEAYANSRPEYPVEAAEWLLPAGARDVVDLGAGTGKFTATVAALGLRVTAVEPDDAMRAKIDLPGVLALAGTGEKIPLPDDSADLIVAAQAWHWVDESLALPEAARVLRPGGTLGLIWNIRDDRVEWMSELTRIMGSSEAEDYTRRSIDIGAPFGATERFEVDWSVPGSPQRLLELVASRSYIITATDAKREAILAGVRELLTTHPQLAGREQFSIPYRTTAYRAKAPIR